MAEQREIQKHKAMNHNKYPQINLADWQQVGEGGTAQAFQRIEQMLGL